MHQNYSLTYLTNINSKPIEWLWYPYIPYGKITIIQGDPGEGKTTFVLSLIASLSRNGFLPCSTIKLAGNSIYQNTEDDFADTIKPRLERHNADCSKICFIDSDEPIYLDDNRLETAIIESKAKLLVLDPIQAFVGENVDMNRANAMRPRLNKLKAIAEKTGCAIVLIGHLNKKSGGKVDYRGLGSIDIPAAARSVLLVGKIDSFPSLRFVAQQKNNLAPLGETLAFSLEKGRVRWVGKFPVTVEELTNGELSGKQSKEQIASNILLRELLKGKKRSDVIMKLCIDEGISERTIKSAKSKLNIKSVKIKNEWFWELASYNDGSDVQ